LFRMIVGLIANKHCGKSYFASRLMRIGKDMGYDFKRLPFAGALKALSHSLFRVSFSKDFKAVVEYTKTIQIPVQEHTCVLSKKDFTKRLVEFGNLVKKLANKKGRFEASEIPDTLLNELYALYTAFHRSRDEACARRFLQLMGTEFGRDLIDKDVWIRIVDRFVAKNPGLDVVIDDVRFPNEFEWLRSAGGISVYIYTEKEVASDTHPSEVYIKELGKKCDYKVFNTFEESIFDEVIKEILSKKLV